MYVLGLLLLFQHTVNSEVFYIFCMQNKSFVSSFAGKMSVFFIIIISIFNQQAHFNLIFFFFFLVQLDFCLGISLEVINE